MTTGGTFLFINGVASPSSAAPPVTSFLESHPGAYTTTRTHGVGDASCLLFWDRHVRRLADSVKILCQSRPELLSTNPRISLPTQSPLWAGMVGSFVNSSMGKALSFVLNGRPRGEELAITALVCWNAEGSKEIGNADGAHISGALDVYVHVGAYTPPVFASPENGARLAVVGRGRDVAAAKYSDWVRLRKPLEKLRPPLTTELLLSNDGDQILEGCITNFFVVCHREHNQADGRHQHDYKNTNCFEVQTAPLGNGVLPGVIRQLVIEVCLGTGIPLREVAPSWSKSETWEEAFITNSLRLIQHVETIQVPTSWESLESKTWRQVSWEAKQFKDGPGMITRMLQREIMKIATLEGIPLRNFEWEC